MKKFGKAVICILIAALTILSLVAKYQTHGAYLGQLANSAGFWKAAESAGSKLVCDRPFPDYIAYQNSFGRTVFVITGNPSHGNGRCIFHYRKHASTECILCDFLNKRIVFARTAAPSLCTHLDFFGYVYSKGSFYSLIQKAGMPKGYAIAPDLIGPDYPPTGFYFDTTDGYRYYLRMTETGEVTVGNILSPDGNSVNGRKLMLHLTGFYLCVAALLIVFLVCFLKVYSHFRKKKAAKHGVPQDSPHRKPLLKAAVCILLILLTLLHISASLDYCVADAHKPAYTSSRQTLGSNGYIVFLNCYNRVAVMRQVPSERPWYLPIGTFSQKTCTNVSMLALHNGLPFYIMCETLGMPDGAKGSAGNRRFIYETGNGYTYEIYLRQGKFTDIDTVDHWTVTAPDGTKLDAGAFQWQVRLSALGIATGLSAFATALILISNHIRKCKATP